MVVPSPFFLQTQSESQQISAIDPEAQLLNMDLLASRQEARQKNAWLIAGLPAAATVTAVAVIDNNNTNNDNASGISNNLSNDDRWGQPIIYNEVGATRQYLSPVEADPWFWSDQTLRKTTLEKGEQVRSKVLFPREKALSRFELAVQVAEISFNFGFLQKLYWPR